MCKKSLVLKNIPIKIMAILLTALMLFSSSFVLIDEHYCQGKLEHFSLFGEADSCDMGMQSCSMENHNSSFTKTSCCINLSDFKQAAIFDKNQVTNFILKIPAFIPNSYFKSLNVFSALTKKSSYYQNYPPPLIFKDILIFIQCFRI